MSQIENAQLISPPEIPTPQTDDRYYKRLGLIVLGLFVGIFGIWGSLAPLGGSVAGPGKVVVASSNRFVEHLEGGIVKSILVKDGDLVTVGQPLLKLDSTRAAAELNIIMSDFYSKIGLESRLIAERDGRATITFNGELQSGEPSSVTLITEGQKREFEARRQHLIDEKRVYAQRIDQLRNQIQGLEGTIASKSVLSRSYDDEVKELEVLFQQQLIDKTRLRDAKREKVRLDNDIASAKSDIARSKGQIAENEAQIIAQKQSFIKEVVASLSEVQTKLSDDRARIVALKDALKRTEIVAPVGGIVTNLQIHTVGGVAPSGKPILEIVPENEPLIIESKVAATDITNVRTGLKAEIRFPSFAHIKTLKAVMGEVTAIAPDTTVDEQSKSLYYTVKIKVTNEGRVELQRNRLSIRPGIPADVMIVTVSRSFADYMIQPITNMFRKAFNEQ